MHSPCGVISPLLSNCYLHLLDRIWEKHQLRWKLKARIVRYADDFAVLCAGKVDAPLSTVRPLGSDPSLLLSDVKTINKRLQELPFGRNPIVLVKSDPCEMFRERLSKFLGGTARQS